MSPRPRAAATNPMAASAIRRPISARWPSSFPAGARYATGEPFSSTAAGASTAWIALRRQKGLRQRVLAQDALIIDVTHLDSNAYEIMRRRHTNVE
jgi:hypothetical protein